MSTFPWPCSHLSVDIIYGWPIITEGTEILEGCLWQTSIYTAAVMPTLGMQMQSLLTNCSRGPQIFFLPGCLWVSDSPKLASNIALLLCIQCQHDCSPGDTKRVKNCGKIENQKVVYVIKMSNVRLLKYFSILHNFFFLPLGGPVASRSQGDFRVNNESWLTSPWLILTHLSPASASSSCCRSSRCRRRGRWRRWRTVSNTI